MIIAIGAIEIIGVEEEAISREDKVEIKVEGEVIVGVFMMADAIGINKI